MASTFAQFETGKQLVREVDSPFFRVVVMDVPNHSKFRMSLDFGDHPGPWLAIGYNSTVVGIGYLPDPPSKVLLPPAER